MTGYDQLANKKQLKSHFESWSEPVLRLLDTAPDDGVMLWDLLDMELLPNLIKGKALLIGDAAHPFLPREFSSREFAIPNPPPPTQHRVSLPVCRD